MIYVFHYSDKDSEHNEDSIYGAKTKEEAIEKFRKRHPSEDVKIQSIKEQGTRTVYDIVTERIVAELQKGIIPWHKPWHGVQDGAISYTTRKPYSLLNQILLGKPGEWLTWKQIQEHGGHVKKGAKASMVTFWKVYLKGKDGEEIPDDAEVLDNVDKRFVLRYYNVYHIDDVEGVESKIKSTPAAPDIKPIDEAEKVAKEYVDRNSPLTLEVCRSNRAFYSPGRDSVTVPLLEQYDCPEEFYSTLFHELTHSTGHKSRLDREDGMKSLFGDQCYSREELVAEMGSVFICNHLGIESEKSFKNSTAYLQGWLKALNNDSKMIVYAASKAEKAAKYILNIKESEAGLNEE